MKRIFIVMMSVLLAGSTFFFTGCDKKGEESSAVEQSEGVEMTTSPHLVSNDNCEYVVLADELSISYTDTEGIDYDVVYRMPEILIGSEDADRINKEINNLCGEIFYEGEQCQENKTTLVTTSLDYASYQNDNIVSLFITAKNCWGLTDYYVYNINTETGEEFDNDDILSVLSMKKSEFNSLFETAINDMFEEVMNNSEDDSFFKEQIDKTLDEDNINETKLFLGNDKSLWALGKVYSVAGGEYYYRLIQLN